MPIRTIETVVDVGTDRRLVVQLPPDVPTGRHRLVAVLDEATVEDGDKADSEWRFPIIAEAMWPVDMPLSRAEMYDDNGR